jgi:hypothetical protein
MFDLWLLGLDVNQVMAARILRMMTGKMSLHEARRMITEKQAAYSHAQIAGAYALLTTGPLVAGNEMINVYRRAVSANCGRLSNLH